MCEEFAPRNGAARASEEGGANRALKYPAGGPRIPKFPARGSRPETENKGLAGSQARTMPATGPPTSKHPAEVRARKPKTKGSRGVEREPCRPAGRQTRNTRPAAGPLIPKFPGANHAGRRVHFAYRRTCKYARRAHPTFGGPAPAVPRARFASQRAGPQQKNTGRQPGVYSYPINPIIPAIPADSGRFPRILPGTLSAAEALLRCPPRGWLPRSAEVPDRAGTSAGGTNRCGRSDRN